MRDADADRGHSVYAELTHRSLTLSAFHSGRTKYVPTASFGALPYNRETFTTDEHAYAELRFAHQFSAGTGLNARAYADRSHYHGNYLYGPAPGDSGDVLNRDLGEGVALGSEWRLTRALSEAHSVQLGVEGVLEPYARQWTYDERPYHLYLDDRHGSNRLSVYAQDELRLLHRLRATLAVRHDEHYGLDMRGRSTDPHLGLVLDAGGRHTVKLIAGSSYRRPTLYEIFYNPAFSGTPVALLRPERALAAELAWEHLSEAGGHTVASLFVDHVRDLIDEIEDADGNTNFVNRSSADCFGMELEREQPCLGGSALASLAVQRAEDSQDARLTNSPLLLAKLRFWRPWARGRLQTAFEYGFVSPRRTIRDTEVAAVHLLNTHVRWFPGGRRLELSLHVHNLFNQEYSDPAGPEHVQAALPQPGRSVQFKLGLGRD